tara:strand:- start:37 stop:693 length:657 start_codon:yes stop_codon:yes gene_type:complete
MLDISQLSRKSRIPASKLRYYEEVGLIRSVGRNGLRRVFETDVLTRLSLIALGQVAGFSLAEIREMLGSERQPEIDRDMVGAKADLLDRRIKELTALREGLCHVVTCSAPSHLECPTFQRLMRIGLTRQINLCRLMSFGLKGVSGGCRSFQLLGGMWLIERVPRGRKMLRVHQAKAKRSKACSTARNRYVTSRSCFNHAMGDSPHCDLNARDSADSLL